MAKRLHGTCLPSGGGSLPIRAHQLACGLVLDWDAPPRRPLASHQPPLRLASRFLPRREQLRVRARHVGLLAAVLLVANCRVLSVGSWYPALCWDAEQSFHHSMMMYLGDVPGTPAILHPCWWDFLDQGMAHATAALLLAAQDRARGQGREAHRALQSLHSRLG